MNCALAFGLGLAVRPAGSQRSPRARVRPSRVCDINVGVDAFPAGSELDLEARSQPDGNLLVSASHASHSRGWTEVLQNIAEYVEQGAS